MSFVEPDTTLFMNDGSTVLALAREIVAARIKLMVVTPGVNIATFLSESPAVSVYLLGGRLGHKSLGTSGDFAERMLETFNADAAFIAAEGFSAGAGLTYSYESDAALARLMSAQAERTIVLATARKLGQRDRIMALPPGRVDVLITDSHDRTSLGPFLDAGIEAVTAPLDDDESLALAVRE